MSLLDDTKNLERRAFFEYERLFAADLNDQESFHREMRWLHNRSLHQPGVGNGYKITGAQGDREVTIGPGYALDAYGREIVLLREVVQPIPPVAGESGGRPAFFYLAVAYPDDARLDETEIRQGVCDSRGAVRLEERPLLCWIRLAVDSLTGKILVPVDPDLRQAVNSGTVVVLAIVEVFQCRLNRDITSRSLLPRRDARPPRLPFTASSVEARPNWIVETIPGLAPPSAPAVPALLPAAIRLKATVKTTGAAVFGAIPRYLVTVAGDRQLKADYRLGELGNLKSVYAEPQVEVVLDDTLTDHTKFTVTVTLLVYVEPAVFALAQATYFNLGQGGDPAGDAAAAQAALTTALPQAWQLVWVGIEG
jgi:hypothetical protein